jgi:(p)ppGpp synthase/HD superfamily hydrolase
VDLVNQALIFATAAHAAVGQRRKYTNEPYIIHPMEVRQIVATVSQDPAMLAAALLHDVVEDTAVELTLIRNLFGQEVADLVSWLTDISRPTDGNRAARKALDRAHIAQAPAAAQTIKCADLISNTRSIVQHDPKFARTYLPEKRELLRVLYRADPVLLEQANNEVRLAFEKLNLDL